MTLKRLIFQKLMIDFLPPVEWWYSIFDRISQNHILRNRQYDFYRVRALKSVRFLVLCWEEVMKRNGKSHWRFSDDTTTYNPQAAQNINMFPMYFHTYIIIYILELLHKLCCWVGLQPYLWVSDKQTRLPKGATWLITLKAPKVNSASKEIASLLRIEGRCRQKLFNMMKYLQSMVLWWYDINEFWHGLNWGAWKLLNLCWNVQ